MHLPKLVFIALFIFVNVPGGAVLAADAQEVVRQITVYKSPTCRCCAKWVKHMRDQGFFVVSENRRDMRPIKQQYGIEGPLQSCHTAIVDDYVIEGHVPASDVKRMLREKPQIAGLTAPGMPQKSPGMQAEGLPPQGYDVLSFDSEGNTSVYRRY